MMNSLRAPSQNLASTSVVDNNGTATTTMQNTESATGKAFKVLKDIPLRRKLGAYLSMFPHEDRPNVNATNVAEMYSDLLRSIMPGAHSEPVVRLAIKIIITQICTGRTSYLMDLLIAQPQSEMRQIISTICSLCMKDLEDLSDSLERKTRTSTPSIPASTKQVVSITWVLIFVAKMATCSAQQLVIDAGVLDVILRVYIHYPTLGATTVHDSECKAELFDSCQHLLGILVASTPAVFNHPVCSLWTDCNAQPPAYDEEPSKNPVTFRAAWRRVPQACAKQRLMSIFRGSLWGSASGIETYCDLVEFTRSENYDAEMVALATLVILKRVISSSNHAQSLISLLTQGSREDVLRVISGIVQLWLESIADQIQKEVTMESGQHRATMATASPYMNGAGTVPEIPTQLTLLEQEKERFSREVHGHDSALFAVVTFSGECASGMDSGSRQAMLEGGAHALVLSAFVCDEYQPYSLIEPFRRAVKLSSNKSSHGEMLIPAPPSLASINAEASTLSISIHTPKFQKNWQGGRFQRRLNICWALVNSLFPAAEDMGEQYEVTRALLSSIVVYD